MPCGGMRVCWVRSDNDGHAEFLLRPLTERYARDLVIHKNRSSRPYPPADLYITWAGPLAWRNNPNFRRKNHDRLARHCAAAGARLLILEHGALDRKGGFTLSLDDIVAWGDYSFLDVSLTVPKTPLPPTVPMSRREAGRVLFCLQMPDDAQLDVGDYVAWACRTLDRLAGLAGAGGVEVRFHPAFSRRDAEAFERACAARGVSHHSPDRVPLEDALRGARVVVAYNSNALLDAVLAGVPIVCLGEGSFVRSLARTSLDGVNNPYIASEKEVRSVLVPLTHTQFSREELAGLGFMDRLERHLARALR